MDVVLVMDTGTVVMFFFTRITGLFVAVEVVSVRRLSVDRDRRVLTFPSGLMLVGKMNLKLFVLCLGGLSLGLAVAIGRGEDAKRDGDAGLKVQIDDFCVRERIFSYNLSDWKPERKDKKFLWLLLKQKSKGLVREKVEKNWYSFLQGFSVPDLLEAGDVVSSWRLLEEEERRGGERER